MPQRSMRFNIHGILLVLWLCFCNIERADGSQIRLCGKKLLQLVEKLCNHCYYNAADVAPLEVQKKDVSDNVAFPWHPRFRSSGDNAFEAETEVRERKPKRGIVDECCINMCSYSHLKSYCCKEEK